MSENNSPNQKRRSEAVTAGIERTPNRTYFRAVGLSEDDLHKPLIGIANT